MKKFNINPQPRPSHVTIHLSIFPSSLPSLYSRTYVLAYLRTYSPPPPDSARPREGILCKRARERPLARHLLRADKGIDGDGDGAVNVLRGAVLAQAHARKGFADADDGFQVADLRAVSIFYHLSKCKKKKELGVGNWELGIGN